MYITSIKSFFKQLNMKIDYEKQILDYNIKRFSLMVRVDLDMFLSTQIFTQDNQNAELQINSRSSVKKIMEDLKKYPKKYERRRLKYSPLSINYRCIGKK